MDFYSVLRVVARLATRLFLRFRVIGEEKIPESGSCILAMNHMSFWDPVCMVHVSRRRRLTFLARASLFGHFPVGPILRKIGAVPVNRDSSDFSALRTAISTLKESNAVALYPQGTRCKGVHPRETEFQVGTCYMSIVAGAPIIPIGIATRGYRVKWFCRVVAVVGEPITPPPFQERKTALAPFNDLLKERISALCDQAEAEARGR